MKRFLRILAAAVMLPLCTTLAQACSYQQQETLFTNAIYREAHDTPRAQAAVASTILQRRREGIWGRDLCQIITRGYKYRLKGRINAKRLADARQTARAALSGFGGFMPELNGANSFYAVSFRRCTNGVVVGDNCFYRAGHHGHGHRAHRPKAHHLRPHRRH